VNKVTNKSPEPKREPSLDSEFADWVASALMKNIATTLEQTMKKSLDEHMIQIDKIVNTRFKEMKMHGHFVEFDFYGPKNDIVEESVIVDKSMIGGM
jgi:hypothetical protein